MLVGRTRLAADLASLGVRPGAVAFAHCRMSALGRVIGGAETVIRALLDALGPEGTLVAYVGWQDGPPDDLDLLSPGDRELVLAEQPVYDPAVARARRDHGRLAEALRTWPGAIHSGHPEAGIAAIGRDAEAVALPHPLDDAYGSGTPYERVVELGGQVVVLGAPLDTVTLVHHAEAIARVEGKRRVAWRCPVGVDGGRDGARSTTSTRARARCRTAGSPVGSTTSSTSSAPPSSTGPAAAARSAPGGVTSSTRGG